MNMLFFKQAFYTAPLKGTILTKSMKRIRALHLLIEKKGFKTIFFHIKFLTHIYKVDSWYGSFTLQNI